MNADEINLMALGEVEASMFEVSEDKRKLEHVLVCKYLVFDSSSRESKLMALGKVEASMCEVSEDKRKLKHVLEFKYLVFV